MVDGWLFFVKFKDRSEPIKKYKRDTEMLLLLYQQTISNFYTDKLSSAKDRLKVFDYMGAWMMLIVPDCRLKGWGHL